MSTERKKKALQKIGEISSQNKALRIAISHMTLGNREQIKTAAKIATSSRGFTEELSHISKQPHAIALKKLHDAKKYWTELFSMDDFFEGDRIDLFRRELRVLMRNFNIEMLEGLIKMYKKSNPTIDEPYDIRLLYNTIFDKNIKIVDKLENIKDIKILMDAMVSRKYSGLYLLESILHIDDFPENEREILAEYLIQKTTRRARKLAYARNKVAYQAQFDEFKTRNTELYNRLLS
jgi:hypothetical protein